MAASATEVLAEALLLDESGSPEVAVTEAVSLRIPSSVACAVTVTVAVPPLLMVPRSKVTLPADWL